MKTKNCINCSKASFCGEREDNKPIFTCKNPYCIFEPIVQNPYHDIIIKELNNGKNPRNN